MANVTVNGQNYTGVEEVLLPVTGGGGTEQRFVLPPSGTKSITANGTHDVSGYASASVNVPSDVPVTQEKTVTPTAAGTVVTPDSGKLLSKVTVNGDADLTAGNIKNGVNIFGVTGTYSGSGASLQSKTVSPSTSQQTVIPDSGYDGLSSVTVNPIQTETKSVTPSASPQQITPTSGKYLTRVDVAGDADLTAGNIKSGVNIFGVTGTYGGGSSTQTATGTVTSLARAGVSVNCGFVPDMITLRPSRHFYQGGRLTSSDMCIYLEDPAEWIGGFMGSCFVGDLYGTFSILGLYADTIENGFALRDNYEQQINGGYEYVSETYQYTAYKFS